MTRPSSADLAAAAPLDRGAREAHAAQPAGRRSSPSRSRCCSLLLFNGAQRRRDAWRRSAPAGGKVAFAQFYTPSIGIFGLTMACYTSVIVGIATARDMGLLKRVRGTPLPMGIYIGSWLTGAVLSGHRRRAC